MPNNIVTGWVGLFSSRSATVTDNEGKMLWSGQHGENASFTIDKATEVTINLGGWANEVTGTVYPKKKYSLVQDMGVHMFATYRITEVDVIDAYEQEKKNLLIREGLYEEISVGKGNAESQEDGVDSK